LKWVFAFSLCAALPASALIHHVPSQYATIQEALNTAAAGDTVLVEPGVYSENLDWPERDGLILLCAEFPDCIIQPESYGSLLRFDPVASPSTVIDGFVFEGLSNASTRGAVVVVGSPTIQNVIIRDCETMPTYGGAALEIHNSSASLFNVQLTGNRSLTNGGALALRYSTVTMDSCVISSNVALDSGGGIYMIGSHPTLSRCIVSSNEAMLYGGGIHLEFSSPIFQRTLIADNYSMIWGAGVSCLSESSPLLINTTISGNQHAYGGGLFAKDGSFPKVLNSVFWGNGSELYMSQNETPCSLLVAFSNIEGGESGVRLGVGTLLWEIGNIEANPGSIGPFDWDFCPELASGCVDSGTDFFEFDDEVLLTLESDEYLGSAPDIGWCEEAITKTDIDPKVSGLQLDVQAYPNPFNQFVQLIITGVQSTSAILHVYDLRGGLVHTQTLNGGLSVRRVISLDGSTLSSGLYIVTLQTDHSVASAKVLCLK
jgi:parallel beta-helix repeat protein